LGPAYLAGFAWGIERGFDRLVQIDADGSHPVKSLPAMLAQSTQHDLVIGSRYTRGGGVANWPRRRQLLSRWGNRYVQRMLGLPVQDATAGFRVYTAAALTRIGVDGIEASGYAFQINMTWRAQQAGLSIVEVPIIFTDRAHGSSKMSGAIIREALVLTTKWGLRSRASALFAAK
jgi:dolichol-phosphate mannosyltransferase